MVENNDIWNKIILPDVKKKKIAIWWSKESDIALLVKAVNKRYSVKYLVTEKEHYLPHSPSGKVGMVISKDTLLKLQDVQLWYQQDIDESDEKWIIENIKEYIEIPKRDIKKPIKEAKELYIYGAGEAGLRTGEIFREMGIAITGFLDSAVKKHGKIYKGEMIFNPNEVDRNSCIVISTGYYAEIYKSLLDKRFIAENIYVDYTNSLFGAVRIPIYEFPLLKME